jgi:hypothetical protein
MDSHALSREVWGTGQVMLAGPKPVSFETMAMMWRRAVTEASVVKNPLRI